MGTNQKEQIDVQLPTRKLNKHDMEPNEIPTDSLKLVVESHINILVVLFMNIPKTFNT